jgi:hypothetical protein
MTGEVACDLYGGNVLEKYHQTSCGPLDFSRFEGSATSLSFDLPAMDGPLFSHRLCGYAAMR